MALPYVTPAQLDKAVTTLETEISKGGSDVMHSEPVKVLVTEEMYDADGNYYRVTIPTDGVYSIKISPDLEQHPQGAILIVDLTAGTMIMLGANIAESILMDGGCTTSFNSGIPCSFSCPIENLGTDDYDISGLMLIVDGRIAFVEGEFDI